MAPHVDILEQRESMRRPFVFSISLHAAIAAAIAVLTVAHIGQSEAWGDPNSLGGNAVAITPVRQIALPGRTGLLNRVANDTDSAVPEPAKPEKRTVDRKADDDAIPIPSKKSAKQKRAEQETYRNPRKELPEYADNQLTSRMGQATTSPLFGTAPGSGGVGVGNGAPFGTRFGAYAALVRDRVARQWRTDQVDSRLRTAPPVIVTFDILRDGEVRNVRIAQTSGNYALDQSAQRAVLSAGPFEPLPAQYSGSSASIEFWFQLKR